MYPLRGPEQCNGYKPASSIGRELISQRWAVSEKIDSESALDSKKDSGSH